VVQVMLGFMAVMIFLLYSVYFIKIIRGNPQGFELEILRSLANWIIVNGASSKRNIWAIFCGALLAELMYFYLTLEIIQNPVMIILTAIIVFIEIFHLIQLAVNLKRFFSGKYLLSQIFNWRVERVSAVTFFTHSFLVLIILYLF
jgi:hypothetical protein